MAGQYHRTTIPLETPNEIIIMNIMEVEKTSTSDKVCNICLNFFTRDKRRCSILYYNILTHKQVYNDTFWKIKKLCAFHSFEFYIAFSRPQEAETNIFVIFKNCITQIREDVISSSLLRSKWRRLNASHKVCKLLYFFYQR